MAPLWTASEIAAATGGAARGDWAAQGVSIDTRSLRPGDLFVALTDVRDGHDFVADALTRGAAGALVSHRPEGVGEDAPLVMVDDVLAALTALGREGRARSAARVIAITGSVGKTSTKEMLRVMLARQGRVHAAEASYNNHWGVPLTLARMPRDTDYALVEIGMNHPGEIAPLARLARPHVALITNVAPAHLEALGSLDAIAREKAAIMEGLSAEGIAVLPADGEATQEILHARARELGVETRLFGTDPRAAYRLRSVRLAREALVIDARAYGRELLVKLPGAGRHFAPVALGALAAADAAGADLALAALDLGNWSPPPGRGARERLRLDAVEPDELLLIDDAYNANPASLGAALEMLDEIAPGPGPGGEGRGRRVAILGDMLELGADEAVLHAGFATHPSMQSIDIVHCVGPRMAHLWEALPAARRGRRCDSAEELGAVAHRLVSAGDVVLVKGSKGSQVARVVDALRNLGQAAAFANPGD
jgi:UDP-N-acetylmuramoyl-tripeptide--D-alanyl-D-alanine ligase